MSSVEVSGSKTVRPMIALGPNAMIGCHTCLSTCIYIPPSTKLLETLYRQ